MASPVPPIEIGTLTASSPQESQFIGSSSGVFFVNTVHRAFAKFKNEAPLIGAGGFIDRSSDVDPHVVENENEHSNHVNEAHSTKRSRIPITRDGGLSYGISDQGLGHPPNLEIVGELIKICFQKWHPLFPFLHGQTFLKDVESMYQESQTTQTQPHRTKACRAVTFQCIFNIAALDQSPLCFPDSQRITSAASLLSALGTIASKHDIASLQALLAAQLYLIATMSLQAASTVGGMLVRLLFHGGFHRCPFRYSQLSQHDSEIRKRIFWSAYVTDRYLSQALGHPLGIQDSDIDVCVTGREEFHRCAASGNSAAAPGESGVVVSQLPEGNLAEIQQVERGSREDTLASYVSYCRLTGRALELFHKSIHARSVDNRAIVLLTSDVHSWWNSLPQSLSELPAINNSIHDGKHDPNMTFSPFFNTIYQQLILLMNRPFLSLDPATPEFRLSLQNCVSASRSTIMVLRDHKTESSWPGMLSGTWMAGLVIAFACELELYPFAKGSSEIEICLSLLQKMSTRFSTARHCHAVLSILLKDLRGQFEGGTDQERSQKRRKTANYLASTRMGGSNTTNIELQTQDLLQPKIATVEGIRTPRIDTQYLDGEGSSFMSWQDPTLATGVYPDIGDVFGQVSWEALFQGDGAGWDSWEGMEGA